jgi:hypothetical protein
MTKMCKSTQKSTGTDNKDSKAHKITEYYHDLTNGFLDDDSNYVIYRQQRTNCE